jgi:hypothetical protein
VDRRAYDPGEPIPHTRSEGRAGGHLQRGGDFGMKIIELEGTPEDLVQYQHILDLHHEKARLERAIAEIESDQDLDVEPYQL